MKCDVAMEIRQARTYFSSHLVRGLVVCLKFFFGLEECLAGWANIGSVRHFPQLVELWGSVCYMTCSVRLCLRSVSRRASKLGNA